jgi:hypothetical protein
MAIFNGKVKKAYYINGDFDTLRVEWEDGEVTRGYILPADPSHPDYQDLIAEGWSKEQFAEDTANIRRGEQAQYAKVVNAEVQARVDEIVKDHNLSKHSTAYNTDAGMKTVIDHSTLWDTILEANDSKDDIFAFKMWALDSELAKKATVDQKKAIRRSKTLLECLSVLYLMQ